MTAVAGYKKLENYLFLEEKGRISFIKPANYEAQKTKKFKQKIGCIENMACDDEKDRFTCFEGKKLSLRRELSELLNGHFVTTAHYRCENCKDCPRRGACCQAKDLEQPKKVTLKKTFCEKRAQSQANITTERGIHLRMCLVCGIKSFCRTFAFCDSSFIDNMIICIDKCDALYYDCFMLERSSSD